MTTKRIEDTIQEVFVSLWEFLWCEGLVCKVQNAIITLKRTKWKPSCNMYQSLKNFQDLLDHAWLQLSFKTLESFQWKGITDYSCTIFI